MKTLSQFLSVITLIAIVSFLQVNTLQAQRDQRYSQRDHRSSNKTVKKVTVIPRKANTRDHRNDQISGGDGNDQIVERVCDHRNRPTIIAPNNVKKPEKSKNYKISLLETFIPFNLPQNAIPSGFVAKGLGHCVSIPCPEGFGEDTVCWRCTEPRAPKPSAPDTKATKN